jgi:hypothetical protein
MDRFIASAFRECCTCFLARFVCFGVYNSTATAGKPKPRTLLPRSAPVASFYVTCYQIRAPIWPQVLLQIHPLGDPTDPLVRFPTCAF